MRHCKITTGVNGDFFVQFVGDTGKVETSWNYPTITVAAKAIEDWLRTVNPSGRAGSSQWGIGR